MPGDPLQPEIALCQNFDKVNTVEHGHDSCLVAPNCGKITNPGTADAKAKYAECGIVGLR